MENAKITYRIHTDPSIQALVFQEMLEKGLHLTDGTPGQRSRMENVAKGDRLLNNGMTIISAHENKEMIGLIFCEHRNDERLTAALLKNPFRSNSTVKATKDWGYIPLGFISVFVRPDKRGQGIAQSLLHSLEDLRIQAKKHLFQHELDLPFFEASGKAVQLIESHGKQVSVSDHKASNPATLSVNFKFWNHWHTHARMIRFIFEDVSAPPEDQHMVRTLQTSPLKKLKV
jgi:GNAT superfamily N-acetyltransferase